MSTAIEWTDETWNPVTGCTRVSPGCAHCYIERTPPFRMQGRRFTHGADGATTGVLLHPDRLEQPRRWSKPRRVFVNSLSDLWHEDVPDEFIAQVFETMRWASRHVFQVLTKRPERARDWFAWYERRYLWREDLNRKRYRDNVLELDGGWDGLEEHVRERYPAIWPLPNVWMGVSIENARYTWRADVLREIPAAVRFISAEPLLGSLFPTEPKFMSPTLNLEGIDWLIVGGESGPGARPMHPDWARELRDACLAHCLDLERDTGGGIEDGYHPAPYRPHRRPAFFFKQWGEWSPGSAAKSLFVAADGFTSDDIWSDPRLADDRRGDGKTPRWRSLVWMGRHGKKRAGRRLDGRTWDEFPRTDAAEHRRAPSPRTSGGQPDKEPEQSVATPT